MTDQGVKRKSVLFICLGNICRSPMAQAYMEHIVKERNIQDQWEIDSAAIGNWHVGESIDTRVNKVLNLRGVNRSFSHIVRQLCPADFEKFDFIFGMDDENMKAIRRVKPESYKGVVNLFGAYDSQGETIIRDPYYDNDDKGFYKIADQCQRCVEGFLAKEGGNTEGSS